MTSSTKYTYVYTPVTQKKRNKAEDRTHRHRQTYTDRYRYQQIIN